MAVRAKTGADAELVHLYDYSYTGCKSCFACKLKNAKTNGCYSFDDNGKRLSAIDRKIYSAIIYTMNAPEDIAEKMHYPEYLEPNANAAKIVLGYCETLCAYNTLRITHINRYEANIFEIDLQNAYDLGKRLVEKARA